MTKVATQKAAVILQKAKIPRVRAFVAQSLPFAVALLIWFVALFAPTFAAIVHTPPALPQRFSSLERIAPVDCPTLFVQ